MDDVLSQVIDELIKTKEVLEEVNEERDSLYLAGEITGIGSAIFILRSYAAREDKRSEEINPEWRQIVSSSSSRKEFQDRLREQKEKEIFERYEKR